MKRMKMLVSVMLCAVLLSACGGGDISSVERSFGTCERYRKAQIEAAMDEVERFFRAEFEGSKLLTIRYDEEDTAKEADDWTERYGAQAIVLKSDFHVFEDDQGVLMPDYTYKDYGWVLVKTIFGWKLMDCGYA